MTTPGNSINETTTGITGFTGTAFTGTAATQYNLLVGGANAYDFTNVAPSATTGVPVVSQGAAADPAFGTAVVPGGGTGLTSTTAYAVVCGGTTSTAALQPVASVGTSGQILTSNGAGALPTFQTSSGAAGAVVLIASATASNDATITFTGLDSTYHMIEIVLGNIVPATDNVELYMRTSTDNGVSYDSGATDYTYVRWARRSNGSDETGQSTTTQIQLTATSSAGSATDESGSFLINIMNQSSSTEYTYLKWDGMYEENAFGNKVSIRGTAVRQAAEVVDAVQFYYSSGNIESGDIRVYGYLAS